ncbi:MAG: hypothetical protein HOI80_06215 [Alphaproteobacteria bacterium]|jgi:hypothetical protein|nr:hypothetical protein [Alphaproteobacteria bacterium]MBT5389864.1 hypothetical protein [Alphaproteobacteria bacterium]MBT5540058.1 hypothetical protein [Alphaproteobacteria bacterium]MBT5655069.1 hypothetical protein [Alphaproteobacteria bacterium]
MFKKTLMASVAAILVSVSWSDSANSKSPVLTADQKALAKSCDDNFTEYDGWAEHVKKGATPGDHLARNLCKWTGACYDKCHEVYRVYVPEGNKQDPMNHFHYRMKECKEYTDKNCTKAKSGYWKPRVVRTPVK